MLIVFVRMRRFNLGLDRYSLIAQNLAAIVKRTR